MSSDLSCGGKEDIIQGAFAFLIFIDELMRSFKKLFNLELDDLHFNVAPVIVFIQ